MTDDKFLKLALSGSFERVAKVAKEREAFNEAMALREANIERTQTMDNTGLIAELEALDAPCRETDCLIYAEINIPKERRRLRHTTPAITRSIAPIM